MDPLSEQIRVLIVDDHPVYREGLAVLLGSVAGVEVVGTASTGQEVVELARELQPDVVVMDVRMPGLDGVEATRQVTGDSPHIAVLVLTMYEDDDIVFAALRAGARGYLLKGANQKGDRPCDHGWLHLVAAGRSNAQIAQALFLSPKTIRNNVSNIFVKLHVADRAQAIVRAREAGWGRRSGDTSP